MQKEVHSAGGDEKPVEPGLPTPKPDDQANADLLDSLKNMGQGLKETAQSIKQFPKDCREQATEFLYDSAIFIGLLIIGGLIVGFLLGRVTKGAKP